MTWGTAKPLAWLLGNTHLNAAYYIAYDTDADINMFGNLGHDLTWWQTIGPHPDWVLYRCDKRTPAWVSGLPVNVPLDVSNPAVVQYQMALIGPYMAQNGYNSFAADVLSLNNGQRGCGVWTHNHTVWVPKFTGQQKDANWAAATQHWVAYTQWYLHSQPSQVTFLANAPSGGTAPNDPAEKALIDHIDGFQDEAGFTGFGNRMIDDSTYRVKIWWAQYIQSQGKAFLVTDLWKNAEPNPAQREYAIATYLMEKYHQAAMVTSKYGAYGVEHYWPEYKEAVGTPCGDMYSIQGVYMRAQSGSLVIFNTGASTVNVTLPKAASSYRDLTGRTVTNPLPVGHDDAWVLLTQNGCS